uniref:Chromo domain-containing protein n=1 Tax=Chromera velia CCMP2878 TaxID=1169474 RepID=A0A0G4GDX2_9ALVE|eukprot:Cvel_21445.t1-p1 / transcript=Cvel_21445.t1 / gene=Cvel_21445 / organism=Chromera_velia_CCMP2878 / gene_product=hypothetical protein / transcript_product=hypothetical protein / location=Cvel_scaffold2011:13632-17441(-) / protein_length=1039 / sequence_SO=supercontig / SO=protein_coding / is_pseudo=false
MASADAAGEVDPQSPPKESPVRVEIVKKKPTKVPGDILANDPNAPFQETFLGYGTLFQQLVHSELDARKVFPSWTGSKHPEFGPLRDGVTLQKSAIFGSLHKIWVTSLPASVSAEDRTFEKMVIRDIAISQWHILVLMDNDTVFLWRQAHDDIRTGCNEWERLVSLEGKSISRVFISGSCMQPNWRSEWHPDKSPDELPDRFHLAAVSEQGKVYTATGCTYLPTQTPPAEEVKGISIGPQNAKPARAVDVHLADVCDEPPSEPAIAVLATVNPDDVGLEEGTCDVPVLFVKGPSGLFVRFKRFPAWPIKVVCGPRGDKGLVLLENGTVWSWRSTKIEEKTDNAQPSDRNVQQAEGWLSQLKKMQKEGGEKKEAAQNGCVGEEEVHGKVSAQMEQLIGSISKSKAIDIDGCAHEFVILTSDGVIHELNSTRIDAVRMSLRPPINQPIEFTPFWMQEVIRHYGNHPWPKGPLEWARKDQTAWADRMEWSRQAEIQKLYSTVTDEGGERKAAENADTMCRVFLFDGLTLGVTQSGRVNVFPNMISCSLDNLESGLYHSTVMGFQHSVLGLVSRADTRKKSLHPRLIPIPPSCMKADVVEEVLTSPPIPTDFPPANAQLHKAPSNNPWVVATRAILQQMHVEDVNETGAKILELRDSGNCIPCRFLKGSSNLIVALSTRCIHKQPAESLADYPRGSMLTRDPKKRPSRPSGGPAPPSEKVTLSSGARKSGGSRGGGKKGTAGLPTKESKKMPILKSKSSSGRGRKRPVLEVPEPGERAAKRSRKDQKEESTMVTVKDEETGEEIVEWEVLGILAERTVDPRGGGRSAFKEYLVDWGPSFTPTWEPEENVANSQELIDEFNSKCILTSSGRKVLPSSVASAASSEVGADSTKRKGKGAAASGRGKKKSSSAAAAAAAAEDQQGEEEEEGKAKSSPAAAAAAAAAGGGARKSTGRGRPRKSAAAPASSSSAEPEPAPAPSAENGAGAPEGDVEMGDASAQQEAPGGQGIAENSGGAAVGDEMAADAANGVSEAPEPPQDPNQAAE